MPKVIKMGLRPKLDVKSMSVDMRVVESGELVKNVEYHWADLPETIQKQLELAGLSTVLQQRCSQIKAAPDEKLLAMQEVWDMWCDGQYEKKREGGARVVAPAIEVIIEKKGCSLQQAQKSWSKYSDEFKQKFEERYKDEIAAILEERKDTAEIDLDDMV